MTGLNVLSCTQPESTPVSAFFLVLSNHGRSKGSVADRGDSTEKAEAEREQLTDQIQELRETVAEQRADFRQTLAVLTDQRGQPPTD